jgi:hypothetical protein
LHASNRTFRDKRALLREAGRNLHVPRAMAQHERWRPEIIASRTEELKAKAWSAMRLPPLPVT